MPLGPSAAVPNERFRAASDTPHAETSYCCFKCGKSYRNHSSLNRHIAIGNRTALTFPCEYCGGEFQRPNGLRTHIENERCTSLKRSPAEPHVSLHSGSSTSTPLSRDKSTVMRARYKFFRLDQAKHLLKSLDVSCVARFNQARREAYKVLQVYKYQMRLERREREKSRNKSRCTRRSAPFRWPFPPDFDYPPPQHLEDLISQQQSHAMRRVRVMRSFIATHCKFSNQTPEHTNLVPLEALDRRIICHQTHPKQAWSDGVNAAQRLLSGHLPRDLHSVLGIAQLASAIRNAMDDIDLPAASEDKFLCDLSRWRLLLPIDSHAAFDSYTDMLWGKRPTPDVAWCGYPDMVTLSYFQDLIAELLSHVGSLPPGNQDHENNPPSPVTVLHPPTVATHSPSFPQAVHPEALPRNGEATIIAVQHEPELASPMELALFSAGAIFGLIMAFLLRESPLLILSNSSLM
jgi:hypothetical protein